MREINPLPDDDYVIIASLGKRIGYMERPVADRFVTLGTLRHNPDLSADIYVLPCDRIYSFAETRALMNAINC